MLKGAFFTESEIKEMISLIDTIDLEIGSMVISLNDKEEVISKIQSVNKYIKKLKDILEE